MEKSILKNVLWFYLFFSIMFLFLLEKPYHAISAFSLGTFAGSLKLLVMGKILKNFTQFGTTKFSSVNMLYIALFLLFYGFMMSSAILGLQFFIFFSIGFVLVNFVVFIHSILSIAGFSTNILSKEGERNL